jgi:hypothetical protein
MLVRAPTTSSSRSSRSGEFAPQRELGRAAVRIRVLGRAACRAGRLHPRNASANGDRPVRPNWGFWRPFDAITLAHTRHATRSSPQGLSRWLTGDLVAMLAGRAANPPWGTSGADRTTVQTLGTLLREMGVAAMATTPRAATRRARAAASSPWGCRAKCWGPCCAWVRAAVLVLLARSPARARDRSRRLQASHAHPAQDAAGGADGTGRGGHGPHWQRQDGRWEAAGAHASPACGKQAQ